MPDNRRILILAYGNPGRRDDGLGPALAAALEDLHLPGVTIDTDYQLTVEHAADVAAHDVVIFVDAACTGPEPFAFTRIDAPADAAADPRVGRQPNTAGEPRAGRGASAVGFSTHSVSPAGVLALARDLFGRAPAAYVLGIRGHEFDDFGEDLSPRAQANLAAALDFLRPALRARRFDEAPRTRSGVCPAVAAPSPAAVAPFQEDSA
jgi:Ni,Fe-hydrogenase maturation factor